MKKNHKILLKKMFIVAIALGTIWFAWKFIFLKPYLDDFKEQREKYENIVDFLSDEFSKVDDDVIIYISNDFKDLKGIEIPENISKDLEYICLNSKKRYSYITITSTSISFETDETGYYSVVYTTSPVTDVVFNKRQFRWLRNGFKWYEVGVFSFLG